MKLKSLKGKIIVGTVAIGIMSSAGLAFANTDAGERLQSWYEGAFGETTESVESQVTAYGESLIPGLEDEYNGMKEEATTDINDTRDSEIGNAESAIESAKESHLENLNGTKEEILAGMQQKFYQEVFLESYFDIQDLAEQAQEYATNDLTAHTGSKGEEALNKVTEDLNTAKEEAVSDLEEAIENAKAEIEAGLANHEEITVSNLNNQIDFAIRDTRNIVEETLNGLVEEQQTIIAEAAAELEGDAMDALDEVVAGIGE
ncbi:hypothetical protein SAMN05421676_103127 [Salinibacillus kushneri]|uniref:Uncharacterized protein n=1 Tax=Salinibacillus kushneri TaxID=237682 RepID=A0A1I0CEC9_9BACI|nr:hypothetical protein [Salinibacillus kushneri]SET17462.1 hypothetical protein SAMN05421676_103127 [Salinibacillus kushneri]